MTLYMSCFPPLWAVQPIVEPCLLILPSVSSTSSHLLLFNASFPPTLLRFSSIVIYHTILPHGFCRTFRPFILRNFHRIDISGSHNLIQILTANPKIPTLFGPKFTNVIHVKKKQFCVCPIPGTQPSRRIPLGRRCRHAWVGRCAGNQKDR